jgi:hypothetical protein
MTFPPPLAGEEASEAKPEGASLHGRASVETANPLPTLPRKRGGGKKKEK